MKKRRLLSIVLSLCMVLMLMPQMVFAEGGVPYLDASGVQKTCGSATVVTSSDTEWTGIAENPGWYVAQGNVTISSRVKVDGDVHLILADDCKLTVNGGIGVSQSSSNQNSLTIYGQEEGTGELNAYAASGTSNAGIGGDCDKSSDSITINGGDVTAVGDRAGSGIGGGVDGGCDSITINGGTVTAIGGGGTTSSGIGAFGGRDSTAVITISGGTVMATGSSCGICASSIGTISTGDNGHAVIFASHTGSGGSAFHMKNDKSSWSGVIFEGNSGQIYGSSVTPSEDFTIPADKTLTIESENSLTIPAGKTLTNNGKIYVDGTFAGTANNLYYPLSLVNATATGDTSEYNSKNYGKAESDITLTPDTPPTVYRFDSWEVSDTAVTIGENNTFTMPNKALTVTAQWKEVIPPEIIEGKGQSITEGEKKALTFRSNALFDDFDRVELDYETLDDKNYTVEEGSTVVTLNADFVAALPAGEHTIGIVSTNGTATTTFIIKEKPAADNSSDTGDSTSLPLLIGLMLLSIAGITGMTGCRRRKRADE